MRSPRAYTTHNPNDCGCVLPLFSLGLRAGLARCPPLYFHHSDIGCSRRYHRGGNGDVLSSSNKKTTVVRRIVLFSYRKRSRGERFCRARGRRKSRDAGKVRWAKRVVAVFITRKPLGKDYTTAADAVSRFLPRNAAMTMDHARKRVYL